MLRSRFGFLDGSRYFFFSIVGSVPGSGQSRPRSATLVDSKISDEVATISKVEYTPEEGNDEEEGEGGDQGAETVHQQRVVTDTYPVWILFMI